PGEAEGQPSARLNHPASCCPWTCPCQAQRRPSPAGRSGALDRATAATGCFSVCGSWFASWHLAGTSGSPTAYPHAGDPSSRAFVLPIFGRLHCKTAMPRRFTLLSLQWSQRTARKICFCSRDAAFTASGELHMESLFGGLAFAMFIAAHALAMVVLEREHGHKSPLRRERPCSHIDKQVGVMLEAGAS